MLRADLYDYSDAYIVVKGVQIQIMQKKKKKRVTSKNNAPFINCILNINNLLICNAEDLVVVMPL